jgi:hypothetical protein
MLCPRSAGTFFASKTQAKASWWARPEQGAPLEVLRWIQDGVKIKFRKDLPRLHLSPRLVPADKVEFVIQDQAKGRAAGAYVDLAEGGQHFLSRSRVHSTAAKDRMVHAFLDLNACTEKKPCTYEQIRELPTILRPNDFLMSLDAHAAFWSVAIHRSSIKFMSSHFAIPASYLLNGVLTPTPLLRGGYWARQPVGPWSHPVPEPAIGEPCILVQIVSFSHARLPFGWTQSPRVYTAVARVVVAALRRAGLRVLIFVDDYLIATSTRGQALQAKRIIIDIFRRSGFEKAPGKGQFFPSHTLLDHLGFHIDSRDMGILKVPERRCIVLRRLASTLLSASAANRRRVSSDTLRVFTGTAISCMEAIPQARLRLRTLFDVQEQFATTSTLKRAQIRDLVWWSSFSMASPSNGRLLWPPKPTTSMYTDASGTTGFGSVLEIPKQALRVHGSFWKAEEIPIPICVKELKALKLGLLEHSDALTGLTVKLFQDNTAVIGAMKSFSSSSPAMMVELREVWEILDRFKIRFEIVYVRSALNPADAPSRLRGRDMWSLTQPLQARLLQAATAPVTLDPFACRQSAVVARYATPLHDKAALAMNGLLLPWAHESLWLSPPWHLLPQVFQKLYLEGCRAAVIIYPEWALQRWHSDLQQLPGKLVRLPPACFCVRSHHPGQVEPFANHAVKMIALVTGHLPPH